MWQGEPGYLGKPLAQCTEPEKGKRMKLRPAEAPPPFKTIPYGEATDVAQATSYLGSVTRQAEPHAHASVS